MAVPTSRALFACAIPTIIVILSYIWFRKKEPARKQHRSRTVATDQLSSHINTYAAQVQDSEYHPDRPSTSGEATRLQPQQAAAATTAASVTQSTEFQLPQADMAGAKDDGEDGGAPEVVGQEENIFEVTADSNFRPSDVSAEADVELCFVAVERLTIGHSPGEIAKTGELAATKETVVEAEDNSGDVDDSQLPATEEAVVAAEDNSGDYDDSQLPATGGTLVEAEDNSGDVVHSQLPETFLTSSTCSEDRAGLEVTEQQSGGTDGEEELGVEHLGGENGHSGESQDASNVTLNGVSPPDPDEDAERTIVGDKQDSVFTVTVEESFQCPEQVEKEEEEQQQLVVDVGAGGDTEEATSGPPPAASPGLSLEESEVQIVVGNRTNTSAYGSVIHSPAEELLGSPTASTYSDVRSEGSSDSGKGGSGSDIHMPPNCGVVSSSGVGTNSSYAQMQVYEFEVAQLLCGRLIGQQGNSVRSIRDRTSANIYVRAHPCDDLLRLCSVTGTEKAITAALELIRRRFPLKTYPGLTLRQVNAPVNNRLPLLETMQLNLPEGVTSDVILSSVVNAGHFFVQQPTHPTHPALNYLDNCMLNCYMNELVAPMIPQPVEPDIICAASTMGGWYRAQVMYLYPDTEDCEVKFVDYGGYMREAISSLRQIRRDFMTVPFQASECYLANVVPIDESELWSAEATRFFEGLAQGQILQNEIVYYSEKGIPFVHLYRIQGATTTFINREMVTYGFARWVEIEA